MQRCLDAGDSIIDEKLAMHADVDERCKDITTRQLDLEQLWREFLAVHNEGIAVQAFLQDAAECESWMNTHESVLRSYEAGDTQENVETLLKKLDDFEKSLQAREEAVKSIEATAESLTASLQSGHLDADAKPAGSSARIGQRRPTLDLSIMNPARRKNTIESPSPKGNMMAHIQMLRSQKRASAAAVQALKSRELPSPPQKRSSAPQLSTLESSQSEHSPQSSPAGPVRILPAPPRTARLSSDTRGPVASSDTDGDESPLV